MSDEVERLLEDATVAIGADMEPATLHACLARWGRLGRELGDLLARRNGFYAYESALLIRPLTNAGPVLGIKAWNERDCWLAEYPPLPERLYFAEDAFGNPFAIEGEEIVSFDAETAETESLATSLTGWLDVVHEEATFWTGWPLAHEWQEMHSAVPLGCRLVPRRPFVLGGEHVLGNLVVARDRDAMRARGKLATQLQGIEPGSPITYELPIGPAS